MDPTKRYSFISSQTSYTRHRIKSMMLYLKSHSLRKRTPALKMAVWG